MDQTSRVVYRQPTADCLTPETKLILDEAVRYLNLEKLMPSYRLVVTVRSGLPSFTRTEEWKESWGQTL